MTDLQVLIGDCRETLKTISPASVQCCITSPPYFGLRNYGHADQIGQEKSPEDFVAALVVVFREVWRVLRDDGTLWLNLGDSYAATGGAHNGRSDNQPGVGAREAHNNGSGDNGKRRAPNGLKPKDLIGIPWMVAFALRADGWYLRSDIIWAKPNCMPESVRDRPTRSHEYLFLLSKSPRYYYDPDAIRDRPSAAMVKQVEEGYNGQAIKEYLKMGVQDASKTKSRIISQARSRIDKQRGHSRRHAGFNDKWDTLTPAEQALLGANKRDVWTVAPASYPEAHFATFPLDLIKPCVLAGSRSGDIVLDPFAGSFTTGEVALEFGRRSICCELNPEYVELGQKRCNAITPGFAL